MDAGNLQINKCNLLPFREIKFMTIIRCKESMLALIANAIGMYNISFFTPFLSVKLKQYHLSDTEVGWCFLLASFPYFVGTVVCPFFFKDTPRKL